MRPFAALFLVLAACPSAAPNVVEPTRALPTPSTGARFLDATAAQREAAARAGLGFGAAHAAVVARYADDDARRLSPDGEPSGCPAVEVIGEEPLTVRYTADGCTAPSGAAYDGVLEVENPEGWSEEKREGGTSIVAERFSTAGITLDGTWSLSETAPERDAVTSVDLAVTIDGEVSRLVGDLELTWERGFGRTVCATGLAGAVDGLGDFGVACDVRDIGGPAQGGFVELQGVDTLRVVLSRDASGCFPAAVDGVAVAPICLDAGAGPDGGGLDGEVFAGTGLACHDGAAVLDAHTVARAAGGVEVALAAKGATFDDVEVHGLDQDPAWADPAYDGWRLALETGDYASGVSTATACAGGDGLHAVFFAYDAAGEVIGCRVAGGARGPGPIDVSECPRG